ncbi:hypothetical protein Leryth_021024 [Lithospermum erythrorhizon]|nr:hypothetical protein Leryth_021024 [Lithospermum erythrorhizon]
MLKVLTSACRQTQLSPPFLPPRLRHDSQSKSPLTRVLKSIKSSNSQSQYYYCRFFCSDSSDAEPKKAEAESGGSGGEAEAEAKASAALLPSVFRPDDCLTVLALPLPHRPLFPGFYMPVFVKDSKLLAALSDARKRQAPFAGAFLVKDEPNKDPNVVSGSESEKSIYDLKGKDLLKRLHDVGTLAQITTIQGEQVVLLGHRRIRITEMVDEEPLTVKIDHLKDQPYKKDDDVIKATSFEVISTIRDVLKTSSLWRDHVQTYTQHVGDFNYPRLADFGAAISGANKSQCQAVLEELDVHKRLQLSLEIVKKEMEISKIQESIAKAIEEKISGEQRRYLLNEQLKAIKKELGLEADDKTALSEKFRERLEPKKEKCPPHVLQVIEEELTKLQLLEASSSEFNVTRNYLDWLTALPWGIYSDENFDVIRAHKILDEDHYGLSDVKERILEFIAVGKLRGTSQGKIICLSGPPGVGKTSIGRSIARALNRKFYRFSVGGLSDVAEIKGHRRTYIGAMPGKMVQCLKSVETANPLVLIDEIDKLGRGYAGDPASAMLELLDPEQNANFLDHYLDVSIDLSKRITAEKQVSAICRSRLRRFTGRSVHIVLYFLVISIDSRPSKTYLFQLPVDHARTCRRGAELEEPSATIKGEHIVAGDATNEKEGIPIGDQSGEDVSKTMPSDDMRESEQVQKDAASDRNRNDQPSPTEEHTVETEKVQESEETKTVEKVFVDSSNLPDFVGKPVFHVERIYDQAPVGVVMGLAWTAMGGSTLYIETTLIEQGDGKGALHVTGQLGDVMKESAQIAHTVARAILVEKEASNPFFANTKLHLHVPAGATPKDGPSAGCTMITSLMSLALNKAVKKDLAMTGEVTLTGKILPIGGVKEKTIAARRSEVKTIIFPSANRRDYDELAPNVKEGLEVHFVDDYRQIFDLAFGDS